MEKPFKAGFVALLGRPNAGKSTLLNALLEFPLSIVTPAPQTTRHRILGILNGLDHQVCLLDTPGWLDKAEDRLQNALIRSARRAAKEDADILVLLAEPEPPAPESLAQLSKLASQGKPVILAVNKADLAADESKLKPVAEAYQRELQAVRTHFISALKRTGVRELLASVIEFLPESPPYFGKDQLSDRWERFFAAELVRETLFELYRQEVPHACAVEIETFREGKGRPDEIHAVIYVERSTQKSILLGKKGKSIRELTQRSLSKIRNFLGRKASLELWVKVKPGWRKSPKAVKDLGY